MDSPPLLPSSPVSRRLRTLCAVSATCLLAMTLVIGCSSEDGGVPAGGAAGNNGGNNGANNGANNGGANNGGNNGANNGGANNGGANNGSCQDDDGDGFGEGCAAGPDCNDADDTVFACDSLSVGRDGDSHWAANDTNSENLNENEEGGLELSDDNPRHSFLWIANDAEGTVSKIDTISGREMGRYLSALKADPDIADVLGCQPGNCPSRTAVDLNGDVWVANRAFNFRGSVTKIANADCRDKNGDGAIQTSHDANGDGRIDRSSPEEFYGADDECILFTATIGGVNSLPRALAIDPFTPERGVGSVWIGAYEERKYYQLNGRDGSLIRVVDVPHQPYGCVMDAYGTLWSVSKNDPDQMLVSIVSATGEVSGTYSLETDLGCRNSYGVTIDGASNVWVAGLNCNAAFRYTPSTRQWMTVPFTVTQDAQARGITLDRDGWVYVGVSRLGGQAAGAVVRFRNEDGSQQQLYNASPNARDSVGVGVDFQGRIWAVNRGSSNATRIDPETGQLDVFQTGSGPYTYSDFTGYVLRNFTAPRGTYRRVFTGCPTRDTAEWLAVRWTADTPPGTAVEVRVKSVNDLAELTTAEQFGPWDSSPASLKDSGVPHGRYIEVETTLTSDAAGLSPVLWDLWVDWKCPPVL